MNLNDSINQKNEMNVNVAATAFPTSATVPFPFQSPYDVQRNLMDAILESLRRSQTNNTLDTEVEVGIVNSGSTAITSSSNSVDCDSTKVLRKDKKRKRRAPIIMLESPTGTGKSMSLACASMAWLRYREQADIDDLIQSTLVTTAQDQVSATILPSSQEKEQISAKPKKKVYDWIEAWQPPSSNQEQTLQTLPSKETISSSSANHSSSSVRSDAATTTHKEKIANFAKQNRQALDTELNAIRSRLDRLLNIALTAATANNINTGKNEEGANFQVDQERTIRENLVRSGVSSVLAKDRKRKRKRSMQLSKSMKQQKKTSSRVGTIENSFISKEDEFLVEEYHSDGDDVKRNSGDLSSDSDDDDKLTLNDLSKQPNRQQSQSLSARAMLEGSNLDGSGYQNDAERNALMKKWDKDNKEVNKNNCADNPNASMGGVTPGSGVRKIIYAARTHSQLSQFIGELRRTKWGKDVKVVALGSRSLLCCNDDVIYRSKTNKKNSRRNESDITEMCLDMQKNKSSINSDTRKNGKNTGCPYLVSRDAISTLAMHSMVRPSDIEDMASLGKASHACSYYASREALAAAEVVVLPYNTLLSTQARESVGLSIRNALIVIDEAHNIPETLRALSSCKLSLKVAELALEQLLAYTKKYSERLAGRNLFYLGQIRKILMAIIKYLKRGSSNQGNIGRQEATGNVQRKEMIAAVDLMFTLKLDNINLFSVLRYLKKSRLSQKLLGFINHTAMETTSDEQSQNAEFMSKHISSMSVFETFLEKLTGTSREGKIIIEWPSDEASTSSSMCPTLRFVQIHSTSQLDNIVEEAHAVILAGGTLRPFSHVAAELFGEDVSVMRAAFEAEGQLRQSFDKVSTSTANNDHRLSKPSMTQITPSLTTFTCGHVIPPNNVTTACLSTGPNSVKLDFRHSSRSSNQMIDELGLVILNMCKVVPAGFVIFLPSYKYESQVFQRWRTTGMLTQIDKVKRIHREPKNSRDVEDALTRYSSEASSPTKKGALLFSVMGGKMSEGINFANDMARCVLVVGLPFPDITDPVLKEKMDSLNKEFRQRGTGINGQDYYQNLCMRTVNQSVGRAIRHANDYASIVLCDYRYSSEMRIWNALPQWLRRGSGVPRGGDASTLRAVQENVRSFFAERNDIL